MKANELRIGNIVMYDNYNVSIVHGITDSNYGNGIHVHYGNCCVGCSEEMIEPIPLTEEWLKRFGFVFHGKCEWGNEYKLVYDEPYISFFIELRGDCVYLSGEIITGDWEIIIACDYVHQLQNIYFTLTGQELHENK